MIWPSRCWGLCGEGIDWDKVAPGWPTAPALTMGAGPGDSHHGE